MYRKEEIVLISSSVTYLKFVMCNDNVSIFTYDQTLRRDILQLSRVNTLSVTLFNDQFSVDDDHSAVFVSPTVVGQYARIVYYSEGLQNPYYASSNLYQFIEQVLRWTSNRIVDGLFLYWDDSLNDINEKLIRPGSFVYDGQFYAYKGGTFNIREQAPPMIRQTFKSYLLVINQEILESYLDVQGRMLTRVGVVSSATAHETSTESKADVDSVCENRYESQPLRVAYVHAYLTTSLTYETWIQYDNSFRSL
jgi:hypothetical protein